VKVVQELEEQIISLLEKSNSPLALSEIALRLGKPEKTVYKSLRKLFEKGKVESVNRQYRLSKK
jgi:DNA-binding IclR family transcriptional regulator